MNLWPVVILPTVFAAGCIFAAVILNDLWRDNAIERSFGLYCPDTGYWAWKDECQ